MHCAGLGMNVYYGGGGRQKLRHLSAAQMEALMAEAGMPPANLYVEAFTGNTQYGAQNKHLLVTDLEGYPDALDRYLEPLRAAMLPTDVVQRQHVQAMLATAHSATLNRLAPQLCEVAERWVAELTAMSERAERAGFTALSNCRGTSDNASVTTLRINYVCMQYERLIVGVDGATP